MQINGRGRVENCRRIERLRTNDRLTVPLIEPDVRISRIRNTDLFASQIPALPIGKKMTYNFRITQPTDQSVQRI